MSDDDTKQPTGIDIPFDVADWGDVPAPARWDELSEEERRETEAAFGADALPPQTHAEVLDLRAGVAELSGRLDELAQQFQDAWRRSRGPQATSVSRRKLQRHNVAPTDWYYKKFLQSVGPSIDTANYGKGSSSEPTEMMFVVEHVPTRPGPGGNLEHAVSIPASRAETAGAGLIVIDEDGTILFTMSAAEVARRASSSRGFVTIDLPPKTPRGGKV